MKFVVIALVLLSVSCASLRQPYRGREHYRYHRKKASIQACDGYALAGVAISMLLTQYSSAGVLLVDLSDQLKSCQETK